MKKRMRWRKYVSYVVIAIGVVTIVFLLFKFNITSFQRTSQSSAKTKLEQAWGLSEWALQDIEGKLYIGPYRDLWKQWYEFIWYPQFLYFWIYNFTYDDAKRFFHELWFNRIPLKWIIESNQYASDKNHHLELVQHFRGNDNIVLLPDTSLGVQFQHAKTFVTDKHFIIQTANITYSSYNKNRELFFFGTHSWVLQSLQKIFDNDRMQKSFQSWDIHPNIVICPINCRQRLDALLQQATRSIMMYQQYIADEEVQRILIEKKQAWVDIKIILWDTGQKNMSRAEKQFMDQMWSSILLQSSPYVHAKWILIDNEFLLVSSMNISETSIEKNREIWILLINRFQIEKFMNMFMKDWNKQYLSNQE